MQMWKFIAASLCLHVSVAAGVAGTKLWKDASRYGKDPPGVVFLDLGSMSLPERPAASVHVAPRKQNHDPPATSEQSSETAPPVEKSEVMKPEGVTSEGLLAAGLSEISGDDVEWDGLVMGVVRIEFANNPGERIISADATTPALKEYLSREDTPWMKALAGEIKRAPFSRVLIIVKIDINGPSMELLPDKIINPTD